jgi:hypothetical protein
LKLLRFDEDDASPAGIFPEIAVEGDQPVASADQGDSHVVAVLCAVR